HVLRHPVFRVLFLISTSLSFAQTRASDKNGENPLADTVRQLASEVQQLKLSIEELRVESDRFRAETRELRRELDTVRSQRPAPTEATSPDVTSSAPSQNIADDQATSSTNDRVAKLEDEFRLLTGKVDDQYQTKVESASKYRLRLSGIALFNLFSNRG